MPSTTTELIKSKLDIVEYLRGFITLTPAGKNFKALCPFHSEKSPSFSVSPERQRWHCFGCGLDGDIFGFVMRYENMEFGEALRLLAEKAGVELKHENPAEYRYTGLLYDLNDAAKNYFRRALAAAPVAKKYLAERGLTSETVETFEIGWAPNEPEGLSMHLLNTGTSPQDLLQSGLSIKTERGLMLDRFRGRIMFPIHNHLGKVVGFTGRILPQLETPPSASGFVNAKYVNSPETPIFQKSKLLYGFWKTKEGIRELKSAFLVEGQMDFLMSWQAGVKNVIASSGTALTADHLRSVHRLAEELIIGFDNDPAGSDAAERAIDLAEAQDFTVKVATFTGEGVKDAADAIKKDPTSVPRAIAAAVPAPEFYFAKYLPGSGVGTGGASGASANFHDRDGLRKLRVVLAKLKHIASPVEREFWLKELAKRTGVAEKTLEEETAKAEESSFTPIFSASAAAAQNQEVSAPKRQISRQQLITEQLFSAALATGNMAMLDDCETFLDPVQREILTILKSGARKSDDPKLDEAMNLIVLRVSGELSQKEVEALKAELAREYYRERRHILTLAIRNAEAKGNTAELDAAMQELRNIPVVPERDE